MEQPPAHDALPLSVVIATFNRPGSLTRLVRQLEAQTLPQKDFETIVVDDGSDADVAPMLESFQNGARLVLVRTNRTGAAGARHAGILRASGDVVVVLDDDVQIGPDFLERHAQQHPAGSRNVVLGRIRPDPSMCLPLFERFHAAILDQFADDIRGGRLKLQGTNLATGNVSFRRTDYLEVGGFDVSLRHSEDAELGIRLEKAGVRIVFSDLASVIHSSEHSSLEAWMRRAFLYGMCDLKIARKHRDVIAADPWRYLWLVHPASRPVLFACVIAPALMRAGALLGIRAALTVDRIGWTRLALRATTVVFGIEYFRGLRAESGSLREALADLHRYARLRRHTLLRREVRHAV
jgi:glycosyltransferase involved in cell wall biosynthesis